MVNAFNLLRLIAALMVFGDHIFLVNFGEAATYGLGTTGVHVFFVLSGYLIAQSWENDPLCLRFAVKRALRLFPALLPLTLLSVFVIGPVFTTLPFSDYFAGSAVLWQAVATLIGLPGPEPHTLPGVFETHAVTFFNGSLWTLRYEMAMYALLALVGILGGGAQGRRWLFPCLTACSFVIYAFFILTGAPHDNWPVPFFWKLGLDFDPMVFSKLMAFFFAGSSIYVWRERIVLSLPVALFLLAVYVPCFALKHTILLQILLFPYLLITLALKLPVASLPWVNKTDISYGVYIYAYPIQQATVTLFGQQLGLVAQGMISLLVILPLATLSWIFVEKPMLAKKPRRLAGAN